MVKIVRDECTHTLRDSESSTIPRAGDAKYISPAVGKGLVSPD